MKHDPHLANDLIIRSLEAQVARLTARLDAVEAKLARVPRPRRTAPGVDRATADKAAPLLQVAAVLHGCTVAEIVGPRGPVRACKARAKAAYDCQRAGLSSTKIGRVLGGRDHSTVLHLIGRHKDRMGIK